MRPFRWRTARCVGLLAGAIASPGWAQGLSADRPTLTVSPLVVPRGSVQLEAGYTGADVGNLTVHSLGEILIRIGLTEPVELRLGLLGYVWLDEPHNSVSGMNDGTIGLKWTIKKAERQGNTDIGIIAGTSVPIGDTDISTGEWEPGATLALGWTLADWLSVTGNVGYAYRSVARRFNQGFVSATVGLVPGKSVSFFVEGYGFSKESAGGSEAFYTNAGAILPLGNRWLTDGRIGIGLGDAATDVFAGVGFVTAW